MSRNKYIKNMMIKKYGARCWIEKLSLRIDDTPRRYTSKKQLKRMKQLTYHHIKERRNGGPTTEENGAILSVENHQWFHKQPIEVQRRINEIFQEYKRQFALLNQNDREAITVSKPEELSYEQFITKARQRYNRAKQKEKDRRETSSYLGRVDLDRNDE